MLFRRRSKTDRRAASIALATLGFACLLPVQPAAAQGLFDSLFGGFHRSAPQSLPPQTSSFADPFGLLRGDRSSSTGGGGSATYCVRTCDGRFFPVTRHAGASPVELCKSFCPAAKTMVFSGSKIDTAVASNGTRYADLDNAFVYRERTVAGCTCNGKDAFGLVRLDTASDPTLRAGDIVATDEGLAAYRGKNSRTAEFTPVNPSSIDRKLSAVKIVPAPPKAEPVQQVNDDPPKKAERRRAQSAR